MRWQKTNRRKIDFIKGKQCQASWVPPVIELVCFPSFFFSCQLIPSCQLCREFPLEKRVYLHDSKMKVISEKLKPVINIYVNFLTNSKSSTCLVEGLFTSKQFVASVHCAILTFSWMLSVSIVFSVKPIALQELFHWSFLFCLGVGL